MTKGLDSDGDVEIGGGSETPAEFDRKTAMGFPGRDPRALNPVEIRKHVDVARRSALESGVSKSLLQEAEGWDMRCGIAGIAVYSFAENRGLNGRAIDAFVSFVSLVYKLRLAEGGVAIVRLRGSPDEFDDDDDGEQSVNGWD